MKKTLTIRLAALALTMLVWTTNDVLAQSQVSAVAADKNVVDEVIWVVGDEPILKSDVEAMRLQAIQDGTRWDGDPDCVIPEQLALQKLFLNQADIDSIDVAISDVADQAEQQINYWIQMIGSKEKLEEYKKQTIGQMRTELREVLRDRQRIAKTRENLVSDVTVTPAEVRRYFSTLPTDSIPFVPTTVEVQIIQITPTIDDDEINRVKGELREFTDRVTKGETSFSTLARLYSEHSGTARQGGELDYMGRGEFDPAFADVAFNLTDPKKISKIVESEYGFHIIQYVDRRGDKLKVRHILMKPVVSDDAVEKMLLRLDSVRAEILEGKFDFELGASLISDDKDTRNNNGLFYNTATMPPTSKFALQDLPPEIAKTVDTMAVGQISAPFRMVNKRGKTVCAIVKLKNRIEGHRAIITEDYQVMKDMLLSKRKEKKLEEWVENKIKNTYVRINDNYKDCKFQYEGWIR